MILIEQEGMRRARSAIANADHVLLMSDAARPDTMELAGETLPEGVPVTRLVNKIDLLEQNSGARQPTSGENVLLCLGGYG